jgi:hypothetical protein
VTVAANAALERRRRPRVRSRAIAAPEPRRAACAADLARDRDVAILHRLEALEQKFDRLLAALEAPPSDPADGRLLAAMWTAIGSSTFTAAACVARATLAADVDLGDALRGADVTTGQELGMALRRLEGRMLNGCCVRRVAVSRAGLVWQVSRVEPRGPREG